MQDKSKVGVNVDDPGYQCCFCGGGIEESGIGAARLDPCAVVLIANWKKPESEQGLQQFFCHLDCFKKTMWPNVPVEVESMVPAQLDGAREH
jgi:hypothetical protein